MTMLVGAILNGHSMLIADTRRNVVHGPEGEPTSIQQPKIFQLNDNLSCQWAGIEEVALIAISTLHQDLTNGVTPESISEHCQRALLKAWGRLRFRWGSHPIFQTLSDIGCCLMFAGNQSGQPYLVRVVLAGEQGFTPAPIITRENGKLQLAGGEDFGSQPKLLSEINACHPSPTAWVEAAARSIWAVSKLTPTEIGGDVDWVMHTPHGQRQFGRLAEPVQTVHRFSVGGYIQ